jgi:hypothetical protein
LKYGLRIQIRLSNHGGRCLYLNLIPFQISKTFSVVSAR